MSIRMVGPIVTPDVRRFSIQKGRLINDWGVDCGSVDDLATMKGKIEITATDAENIQHTSRLQGDENERLAKQQRGT